MNRSSFFSFQFVFFLLFASMPAGAESSWETIKSDHFVLYFRGQDKAFPGRVLREAESHYEDMVRTLGFSRKDNFWLWEKRCTLYLYASKEEYHQKTGQPQWSSGFAVASKRKIVSFQASEEFLISILPHELAHLIFYDFLKLTSRQIPLWVDEGLAMSQEKAKRTYFDTMIKNQVAHKQWIPFSVFFRVQSAKAMSDAEAALFYAQAQSLVRFLIQSGPSRFLDFCRNLRDGASVEEALRKSFPTEFPDLKTFEDKWLKSI